MDISADLIFMREGGRCWYTNNRLRQQEDSIIHISTHTAVNSSPVFAKDQLQNMCCSPEQDM